MPAPAAEALIAAMKRCAAVLAQAGIPFALAGGAAAYARGAGGGGRAHAGARRHRPAGLGNHDYHSDQKDEMTRILQDGGVCVLEGSGTVVSLPGGRLGVTGTKGFGGRFPGRSGSEFGEPEMKAFMAHSRALAASLAGALHGHARAGTEKGLTPGGVSVRNVALPVLRRAFAVYCLPGPQQPE
jgi:hypothetical protein